MTARLLPEAFATLTLTGRAMDAAEICADPWLAGILRTAGKALREAVAGTSRH
jgi:hypothetical protein